MLEPFLCGLISEAPLLPKLRGHFAEFLNNASPAGLRILSSSTCVGLRYGCSMSHSGFSRYTPRALRYSFSLRLTAPVCSAVFPSEHLLRLRRASLSRLAPRAYVPAFLSCCSAGISTCCPSAAPSGLALGPDLPGADQLYPGILGYSAKRIPTSFSLLIPAFSLPGTPPFLSVRLPRPGNAPLPTFSRSRASAVCFSPGHFRRRTSRLVGCYALFECVAASEPTSQLSSKSHILYHLTHTSGP